MTDRGTIIVTARVAYSCDYNKNSDLKFFSQLKRRIQTHFSYSKREFSTCKKKKLFWSKVLHCDTR